MARHNTPKFKEAKKYNPALSAEGGRTDNSPGLALITTTMKWEIKAKAYNGSFLGETLLGK